MKICLLTQNLYSLGGIQRVLSTVFPELIARGGYEVSVLMPFDEKDSRLFQIPEQVMLNDVRKMRRSSRGLAGWILAANKRVSFLNRKMFNSLVEKMKFPEEMLRRYANFINEGNFDVVIGVNSENSLLAGALSDRISARTVGWQHSTFESYFMRRGTHSFGLSQYAAQCYRKLDGVWVLTRADKREFDRAFGIDAQVLYDPIPTQQAEPAIPFLNRSEVIFVGRLNRDIKGLDYLIEIVSEMQKQLPQVRVTVVGDGGDRAWMEKEIRQRTPPVSMDLVGATKDVSAYYERAALMLLPSRQEGFGMSIVEAMSFGVPTVAFHNLGPDEVIRDGVDGYLIDRFDVKHFADKAVELLTDGEKREAFCEEARKRAKAFEIDTWMPTFEEYLNDAANRRK